MWSCIHYPHLSSCTTCILAYQSWWRTARWNISHRRVLEVKDQLTERNHFLKTITQVFWEEIQLLESIEGDGALPVFWDSWRKGTVLRWWVVEKGKEQRWFVTVLLLFRVSVREDSERLDYTFLQCMEVTRSIDTVDETLGCACVCWSTDDEVDGRMTRGTDALEGGHPSAANNCGCGLYRSFNTASMRSQQIIILKHK